VDDATDEELLARVARRDERAFEELYRRHAPAVHGLSRRLSADPEVAAEVTQVAFMRLWDRAHVMHGESRVRPWLTTVAYNAAMDRHRRRRVATVGLAEDFDRAAAAPGPDDEAIMTEQHHDVRTALRELSKDQRSAIELSYFGGLSQSEIARLTGEPLGTVKGRIRLGMRRLRTLIAGAGELA
jgi:RNA polymerase sigma-70 factor, ECF subfamily